MTVTHNIVFIISVYPCNGIISSKICCSASRSVYNFNIIFPLQLLLYEYHCKVTLEYEKEIPQEGITWISIELVRAEGQFSLKFQISLNCF